jgi:hypothetical protein
MPTKSGARSLGIAVYCLNDGHEPVDIGGGSIRLHIKVDTGKWISLVEHVADMPSSLHCGTARRFEVGP